MRVGIYVRVSTQRQAQAQNIEQQLERLQAHALLRERRQARFELEGAAYAGDAKAFGDMIDRLRSLDEQLARCAAETARAVEEAQSRLAQERLAISPTEIHRLH